MILLTLIAVIFLTIVFLKAKKIKELNKSLINKETMFITLYEQRFENFVKLVHFTPNNIQESIYMDIGELRKKSIFIKKYESNKQYLILEEKLQLILKKIQESEQFSKVESKPEFIAINVYIEQLNSLIDETKIEYNNLIDDFNQETTDFFGKRISKKISGLKVYNHI